MQDRIDELRRRRGSVTAGGPRSHHFAHGFTVFQQMVDLSGYVPVVAAMLGSGSPGRPTSLRSPTSS